jgi:cytochrome c553
VTRAAAARAARTAALAAAMTVGLAAAAPAAAQSTHADRFAAVCAACHGVQGHSTQPLTPSLGGQPSFYAITQLFLFREGRRDNPLMTAVAKGMSDDDLRGFSDLIATLPPPAPAPVADAARAARGAALATRLHCTGCHGTDLAGGRQVPRLAGQREDYLLLALRGFRSASRVGYTPAMTEALAGVAPDQLEDLAHYLATFKP